MSSLTPGPAPGFSVLDLNDGLTSQALGHRAMLDWLHGGVPWWNPYEGTGAPLAGEMASAGFFPPTLFTLLAGGQLFERMLLEMLAGVSTFLLLRRLSINRTGAVAGAIAFEINGTFAWFAHAPINPIPFLPMLLLGIELAYASSRDGRHGGWWLITLAGALSVYAGFPETTYIDSLLVLVWTGWRASCLRRLQLAAFARKVSAGAIVGLLLSAPLLLAFVNYLGEADLGVHGSALGAVTIAPRGLAMLFMPYVFGPIFAYNDPAGVVNSLWKGVGGYLTTSLLLFAVFGFLSRRTRALKLILLGWIILVLARAYGEPPLLGHILGILPGMSHVAFYRYVFPSLELPVVILAVLGLDDLACQPRSLRRVASATVISLLALAAAIFAAAPIDHQLPSGHSLYSHLAAVWAVSAVVLAGAATLASSARLRTTLVALVIGVDSLVPFITAQLSTPRARLDLAPVRYLQRHLGLQRFFTMGPLAPNYGSYFGLAELNAADLPLPSSFTRYVHSRLDPYTDPLYFVGNNNSGRPTTAPSTKQVLLMNLASFRDAGVAYVLTPSGQRLPQGRGSFQLVFQSPSSWIYHLTGAAPYFSASSHSCQVTPHNRQSVQVRCSGPTILLRRETDFSGWSADINGRALKIRQADGIFQAVSVPAGTHEITFSYAPPGSTWALLGVLVAFGGLIGGAVVRRPYRRSLSDDAAV